VRADKAPVGRKLAISASTYALICTTPRLTTTGVKLRNTSRTSPPGAVIRGRSPRASASTVGSCTATCNAEPITAAHATAVASA